MQPQRPEKKCSASIFSLLAIILFFPLCACDKDIPKRLKIQEKELRLHRLLCTDIINATANCSV